MATEVMEQARCLMKESGGSGSGRCQGKVMVAVA